MASTLIDGLLEKPFDGSDAVPGGVLRDKARSAADIFDTDLCALDSVIVRQDTKFLESFAQSVGIPYEAKQMYRVTNLDLPAGRRVALAPDDPEKMVVNNTEMYNGSRMPLLLAREESSLLTRCCLSLVGGLHLRPFVMHVHEAGHNESVTQERTLFRRPCRIGAKFFGYCLGLLVSALVAGGAAGTYAFLALHKRRTCSSTGDSDSGSSSGTVTIADDTFPCNTPWLEMQFIGIVIWATWLGTFVLCLPCSCCMGKKCRKRTRFEMWAERVPKHVSEGIDPVSAPTGQRRHSVNGFSDGAGEVYGRIVEKTEPYGKMMQQCCCYCTFYDEVYEENDAEGSRHAFTTRMNYCCCGRVNNCCGATCCKHDFIIDILDPDTDCVVATIQRTYAAGEGCDACCRCMQQFQTYL